MSTPEKNWDLYVKQADEVSQGDGFRALRDEILRAAAPLAHEVAVDIGAGTGLLTLPLAASTSRVWAIDISSAMCDCLAERSRTAQLSNIEIAVASADELPIENASVDLVVSNYCFHHLNNAGKHRALSEVLRILRPGGRLVFADMMFQVGLVEARDRRVVVAKIRSMLSKGPAGLWRLLKNLLRYLSGRWERPARADWWRAALRETGFSDIQVRELAHEGGVAEAVKR